MPGMKRMTRQRAAVLAALEGKPEFRSAQQVHQDLERQGAPVSLATVYRNLATLEKMGRLDAVRATDGELLYRLCDDKGHHHHLVCEVCSLAEEVDLEQVEPLMLRAATAKGFKLTAHDLELFGVCQACQDG